MANLAKAVSFMLEMANDNSHGYDQTNRNGPDYDCSSLVSTALHEAGFNISPYSWTGNMLDQLRKCGFVDCKQPYRAGDVHLKVGKHVCMSISSTCIAQASINEKGTAKGGKTGDQTGNEINVKEYYDYKNGGWDYHLRYTGKTTSDTGTMSIDTVARLVIAGKYGNMPERKTKLEALGYNYEEVRAKVNALLSGKELKSNEEIAREVIKGNWGNMPERKSKLEAAGYDYEAIRKIVNTIL